MQTERNMVRWNKIFGNSLIVLLSVVSSVIFFFLIWLELELGMFSHLWH